MKKFLLICALFSTFCHAESPYTQPDKISHYAGGATTVAVGSIFFNPEVGLALNTVLALGKEYYDYKHPCCHNAERADAGATILGGLLVYAALKTEKLRLTYFNETPVLNYAWSMK